MKFRLVESIGGDYITLYHNTHYPYVDSIRRNGLKIASSRSEKPSGWQMTWATTKPSLKGEYGGCIVKFRLPKDYNYEKVNDDQYIIYGDIEPELIEDIDIMIGDGATGYMHLSELQDYISEYGKETVKRALAGSHNEEMSLEELKKLTPELGW